MVFSVEDNELFLNGLDGFKQEFKSTPRKADLAKIEKLIKLVKQKIAVLDEGAKYLAEKQLLSLKKAQARIKQQKYFEEKLELELVEKRKQKREEDLARLKEDNEQILDRMREDIERIFEEIRERAELLKERLDLDNFIEDIKKGFDDRLEKRIVMKEQIKALKLRNAEIIQKFTDEGVFEELAKESGLPVEEVMRAYKEFFAKE